MAGCKYHLTIAVVALYVTDFEIIVNAAIPHQELCAEVF